MILKIETNRWCSLIMVHVQLPTWWVSTGKVTYVEWTHWNGLPPDLFLGPKNFMGPDTLKVRL